MTHFEKFYFALLASAAIHATAKKRPDILRFKCAAVIQFDRALTLCDKYGDAINHAFTDSTLTPDL